MGRKSVEDGTFLKRARTIDHGSCTIVIDIPVRLWIAASAALILQCFDTKRKRTKRNSSSMVMSSN